MVSGVYYKSRQLIHKQKSKGSYRNLVFQGKLLQFRGGNSFFFFASRCISIRFQGDKKLNLQRLSGIWSYSSTFPCAPHLAHAKFQIYISTTQHSLQVMRTLIWPQCKSTILDVPASTRDSILRPELYQ
uniref:Uncharacterized protein n=1 Tax=Arundo donax TaxID=35708 RepID=A0A0A9EXV3_ARUDO